MSAQNEYIPNGNGHTNGNGKIFSLKPAIDPDTLCILDARRNALALPPKRLNQSQKAFFCDIIDRALNPQCYDSKGVVTVSDKIIGETFHVSTRTVYTWKKAVEREGLVWITEKFKTNMWPITQYHLTCLHRPRQSGRTDSDGTYGVGNYRPKPANPGNGARRPGQPDLPLPGSRIHPPDPKSDDLQGISAESGNSLRLSAEENFGSEPKNTSAQSRRILRARAEENFGSEPKNTSGESRSQLRPAAEADCQHLETQIRDLSNSETKGEPTPQEKALEVWIKELGKLFPGELEKKRAEMLVRKKQCNSARAKAEFQQRIDAIEERLYGPKVKDDASGPATATPATAAPIAKREPTPEEILEGGEYLVSVGKTNLLTAAQKRALAKVKVPF